MLKVIQILFILLFSGSNDLFAQKTNYFTFYIGGEDSLKKELTKNIIRPPLEIRDDYVFHFEVTLDRKGYKSAREIFKQSTEFSNKILTAIQETAPKWNKSKKKITKIVIPVILEVDKKSSNHPSHYKVTEIYGYHEPLIHCYLMSPVFILHSYNR